MTETTSPLFEKEAVDCCVCRENEATHTVAIRVARGLDYPKQAELYSVNYSVCGTCAQDVVEVKLNAQLLKRARV